MDHGAEGAGKGMDVGDGLCFEVLGFVYSEGL